MRNQWMDIAKGIGIILVILGHTSIPKVASDFIYAFHMPLFFFASGWMTKWDKYTFKEFLKRKGQTLCIPFLAYSIIVILVMQAIGEKSIGELLSKGWEGYALWFVPVLFTALVLSKLIFDYVSRRKWQLLVALGLMFLSAGLRVSGVRAPWTMCSVPYATSLVILGTILKEYEGYIKQPRWYLIILGFIITLVISHFFRLDIAWNKIVPVITLTIGAIAGTAMVFSTSSWLEKKTKFTSSVLQEIGKETFIIIALFQVTHMAISYYLGVNTLMRYLLSILVLVVWKFSKDYINKLLNFKLF